MHVRKGDRVHAGDLLITFDLDLLARKAPSLMTPVIVTNADRFRIAQREYASERSPAAMRCSRSNSSRAGRAAASPRPRRSRGQRIRGGGPCARHPRAARQQRSRASPRACPTKSNCALAAAAPARAAPWR